MVNMAITSLISNKRDGKYGYNQSHIQQARME